MKLVLFTEREMVRQLEYSLEGDPPSIVLNEGQAYVFVEHARREEIEGPHAVYVLEPVYDPTFEAFAAEVVNGAEFDALSERLNDVERMNLTLAGIVDDLKKQRAEHEAASVNVQKVYAAQREELRDAHETARRLREELDAERARR